MKDEAILQMFEERDERAIRWANRKYGNGCMKIARDILRSPEDAEEAVDDMWLRVWEAIPPAHPDNLFAFLSATVRNCALNRVTAGRTQKRGGGEQEAVLDELAYCVADKSSVEDTVDAVMLQNAIEQFLDTLSYDARTVFVEKKSIHANELNGIIPANHVNRMDPFLYLRQTKLQSFTFVGTDILVGDEPVPEKAELLGTEILYRDTFYANDPELTACEDRNGIIFEPAPAFADITCSAKAVTDGIWSFRLERGSNADLKAEGFAGTFYVKIPEDAYSGYSYSLNMDVQRVQYPDGRPLTYYESENSVLVVIFGRWYEDEETEE